MSERLDKWIASRTTYSRKDVKSLIKNRRIQLNGRPATDAATHISETDTVEIDGEKLSGQRHIYIMQNKPQGVVSVSNAPGDRTVIDLLPQELRRSGLFPAGRLDRDTTGFVLITDDGDFAHRILSPRHHVTKKYTVTLRDDATPDYVEAFEKGLVLADGTQCLSACIEFTQDPKKVIVYLKEGRYHQVKRMFASLGNSVLSLHRDQIGGLPLDPHLQSGESRLLSEEEILLIES